jgi:anti-sigma factor RsiW
MKHPDVGSLALYAGGEIGILGRWRVAAHLASCEECRREVETFRRTRAALREEADGLPPGLNWAGLEAEMKANIRLGLAAGAIVDSPVAAPERLGWRAAAGVAMATLMVVAGWFLNIPRPVRLADTRTQGVVLEATQAGLEVRENGRALTMLQPASTPVTYSVSAAGSLRARYVDGDTGQVTITNVYAQ